VLEQAELYIYLTTAFILVLAAAGLLVVAVIETVETIDRRKIQRIRRATAQWLRDNRPGTRELRFDAAAVLFALGLLLHLEDG